MKLLLSAFLAFMISPAFSQEASPSFSSEENCNHSSKDWQDHYRHLSSYIPTADDAVITVHCNILVWQNDAGTTNWQDTPEHRQRLRNFFHHPTLGLNFQMYERFIPPTDPVLKESEEVKNKNIYFKLEGIYFFKDSACSSSMGMSDKRKYLRENGYGHLLHQVNVNITTSGGPMQGAWGHAERPDFYTTVAPMVTTTDDPNQRGYSDPPPQSDPQNPVSIASLDGTNFHRDWSFMEHLAHELGHCLDLLHVYKGKAGGGYEDCDTSDIDYMSDLFPLDAPWCGSPPRGCQACVQYSDSVKADWHPNDGRTNNLMNGKGGRYLSPSQLGKIHRALATKSLMIAASGFSEVPLEITKDETWDFTLQLYRPLVIKSGVTLTLKCQLRMPQKGQIIIEPEGKLIVDGGEITRSNTNAGDHWQGIELIAPKKRNRSDMKPGQIELINGGKVSYELNRAVE